MVVCAHINVHTNHGGFCVCWVRYCCSDRRACCHADDEQPEEEPPEASSQVGGSLVEVEGQSVVEHRRRQFKEIELSGRFFF